MTALPGGADEVATDADVFQSWRDEKKRLRAKYGVECPECKRLRPKTNASILLPKQRCKVDGYRDPRPLSTIPDSEREWKRTRPA
jgi:hypothetical protein